MQKFPLTKHSKRYWLDKVYKPAIQRADGSKSVSENYAVYLCHAGKEKRLSLGTPNQVAAAELARDWFVYLSANGWDAFQARYRNPQPDHRVRPGVSFQHRKDNVTLANFWPRSAPKAIFPIGPSRIMQPVCALWFRKFARSKRINNGMITAMAVAKPGPSGLMQSLWPILRRIKLETGNGLTLIWPVATNSPEGGARYRATRTCGGRGRYSQGRKSSTNFAR